MPNWCSCDLFVSGKADRVKEFQEFAKSGKGENLMMLDMDKFIPYPEKFKELDRISEEWDKAHSVKTADEWRARPADGYNQGGYDWCIENWGTKWNFARTVLEESDSWKDETTLKYTFDTAWSPPTPVIEAMGKKFPELEFDLRYFEGGCGFNGMFVVKGGEVTDDKSADYFGSRGG